MHLDRELAVATRLARAAGAVLRFHQAAPLDVGYKAHGEVVTPADRAADALIRAGLAAAFADDAIFSEETPDSADRFGSERVWIVDPLDSTSTFAAGGDEYAVSIGLAIGGEATLGVVYNSARDELFAGCRGHGVTLNGAPVRASDAADLARARLTVSRKEWDRGLAQLAATLPVRPIPSMAYKLARVAAGLDDGVFSATPRKEWGTCAGIALILAAGGKATLRDGGAIRFNRRAPRQPLGLVAAGPSLHPLLLAALARVPETTWAAVEQSRARARPVTA